MGVGLGWAIADHSAHPTANGLLNNVVEHSRATKVTASTAASISFPSLPTLVSWNCSAVHIHAVCASS